MSYILDALKKSEQERGHGGIPSVQTVHSSSLNYNNNETYWPYILITAVLLNLAAILYFVFDKNESSENNISATDTNTIENKANALTATKNTTSAEQNKQLVDITSVTNSKFAEEQINNTSTTAAHIPANNKIVTLPVTGINTKNSSSQITTIADGSTLEDNTNIIEFHELPKSIKQQLPAIIISVHVYSTNPLQRSIVINNNIMEEGEYFLDDLILYEITDDGAVFDYKGTKFHHGVVSGWQ